MSYDYRNIRVEVEDRIATVVIDRPDVLNALDAETTAELDDAFERLDGDREVGAVIVTGAGDRAFVAGADIKVLARCGPEEGRRAGVAGQRAFDRIAGLGKPVIAAINGFALGGGCELALACHLRIASDRARIGLPEIDLGIIPGHGGTQRLPRLLGTGAALELICSGDRIDAERAERIGLVNRVVPHEELMERTRELAARLAGKAPVAMRYALRAVRQGLEGSLAEGQAIESTYFGLCFATEDMKEGTTAFLEKREPEWRGR